MSQHRNLGHRELAFANYDAFLDDALDGVAFDWEIYHSQREWNNVYNAVRLFEDGLFGRILTLLDRQPSRQKWNHMKHADCIRCGAESVGILGITRTVETPDGDLVAIHQHSELCPECADQVAADLRDHGQPQPTLTTGVWWSNGGETA